MAPVAVKLAEFNTKCRKVYIALTLLSILFLHETCTRTPLVMTKERDSMNANHPFIDQSDNFQCSAHIDGEDYSMIQPHDTTKILITNIHEYSDTEYPILPSSMPSTTVLFPVCFLSLFSVHVFPWYVPKEDNPPILDLFTIFKGWWKYENTRSKR